MRSFQGCAHTYAQAVIQAFSNMTEVELRAKFDAGRTHLVRPHNGKVILDACLYDHWIDVRSVYDSVRKVQGLPPYAAKPRGRVKARQ
jgi:hypothetical protein